MDIYIYGIYIEVFKFAILDYYLKVKWIQTACSIYFCFEL